MSWERIALPDLCEIQIGKTPARKDRRYWDGGIYPWASISDLSKDPHLRKTKEKISEIALKETKIKRVPAGTVMMSFKLSIGKVGIASRDIFTNEAIAAFPIKDISILDRNYFACALKNLNFEDAGDRAAKGRTLNKKSLAKLAIPLPPLAEQKRIAAILDQADALRQKRQQALDHLNQLGQSIFYEMFGDPHSNPQGHEICKVGELADSIVPGRDKPKSFSGGVPCITTGELVHLERTKNCHSKKGLSEEEIKNVRARVIPSNSVVMTCVGDLGVVSIADEKMVINQQLHSFQCGEQLKPEYLMYALSFQKAYMLKMATSTTLPYMNKSICNGIPVQIPAIDIQKNFSLRITELTKTRVKLLESQKQLDGFFASLQQRAFRGEL